MLRCCHKIENQGDLHPLRIGRFTASEFGSLFMGKNTAGYRDVVYGVACERLTGITPDGFGGSKWTERGKDLEPFAVEQYEIDTFSTVESGGFWTMGDWYGASPDGLIEPEGLFEGKAPKYTQHVRYLMDGILPKDYEWQVPGQLLVTDRAWGDFQSYHPGLPTFRIRVHRDEKVEAMLLKELELAREKAEEIMEALRKAM